MIKIKSVAPFPDHECREFDDQWAFIAWLQRLDAYDKLKPAVQKALQTLVAEICAGNDVEEWEIGPRREVDNYDAVFVFSCCDMGAQITFDDDGDCHLNVGVQKSEIVAAILKAHRHDFIA